jgi:thioester reductase-like protein
MTVEVEEPLPSSASASSNPFSGVETSGCIHDLFEESAAAHPRAVATVYRGRETTLGDLDRMSSLLARWLYWEAGCRVGSVVGVLMERCDEYPLAMLAALKCGGAYLPLEIVYPKDLLSRVLEEAAPCAVLTKSRLASSRLPEAQLRLCVDYDDLDWLRAAESLPELPTDRALPSAETLAYVVMSSGTTGVPKGICCPHRGAVHSYLFRLCEYPYEGVGEAEAIHIFTVWEVLRPMLGGVRGTPGAPVPAHILSDNVSADPFDLAAQLEGASISRMLFTPSLLNLLLDTVPALRLFEQLRSLRVVYLCGEVVTQTLAQRCLKILPGVRLLNLYSISECHDVSYADLSTGVEGFSRREGGECFASCGLPLPAVTCRVLDDALVPVARGEAGRMFVGGPCLALGYLNRADLTSQRFLELDLEDAGAGGRSRRYYDTGDRARLLSDGSIEVLGRCDFMVKIRGYSVVIGAVEAAIAAHPRVSTACVLTEGEEGGDKRLVAYVVPRRWESVPSVSSVQRFVRDRLPPYAIPSVFILLDGIPLNLASGKVDKKALPSPSSDAAMARMMPAADAEPQQQAQLQAAAAAAAHPEEEDEDGAPRNRTERMLARAWARVLPVDATAIRCNSDFYDLGGHSLLIFKLVAAVKEEGAGQFSVQDVLECPRLSDMAARLDGTGSEEQGAGGGGGGGAGPEAGVVRVAIDLPAEAARLDASIYPAPTRKNGYSRFRVSAAAAPPSRILLTGCTGFLGVHLLEALLARTRATVYLLVRAQDEDSGMERVRRTLREAGISPPSGLEERCIIVPGDLAHPLLGLSEGDFKSLAGELDAIIHCGAAVNLVKPYEGLKAPNVLGTQEVLRLAVTNGFSTRVKPVHFVSTNGVFSSSCEAGAPPCLEADDAASSQNWQRLDGGYAQTKWVAEQMCRLARTRGLPVSILRCGNLAPSSRTGVWNTSDFIYLALRGSLEVGAVPADAGWALDMTPVDFAAAAIVHLTGICPSSALGRDLHIQSPHPAVPFVEATAWVRQGSDRVTLADYGTRVSALAVASSAETLRGDGKRQRTANEMAQLASGMTSIGGYLASTRVFDCASFTAVMEGSGICCPKLDADLMAVYRPGLMLQEGPEEGSESSCLEGLAEDHAHSN